MAGFSAASSDSQNGQNSKFVSALEAALFVENKKSRISDCWRLLGLKADELTWLVNSEKGSTHVHEQLLLLKTPKEATGHAGISHGGFLATVIDESLCYAAYPVLPNHIGVTASLSVDYLQPVMAESWIVIRSIAESESGSRKAKVEAEVFSVDLSSENIPWKLGEKPHAKATQLVVEPKWHAKLARKS